MVGVARLWPCRRRHRFGFFSHDKPKALRSSWPRRSGRLHSELTSRGRALVAGDGMGVRGDCKLLFFWREVGFGLSSRARSHQRASRGRYPNQRARRPPAALAPPPEPPEPLPLPCGPPRGRVGPGSRGPRRGWIRSKPVLRFRSSRPSLPFQWCSRRRGGGGAEGTIPSPPHALTTNTDEPPTHWPPNGETATQCRPWRYLLESPWRHLNASCIT